MTIIKGILDIGAVVMLPIVMLILCLIFRMPFGKSLKAGLMIGIGFSGLSLVIGALMTTVDPAIKYYQHMGKGFTTVDVGWAAVGAASFGVPFAAPAIRRSPTSHTPVRWRWGSTGPLEEFLV